MQTQQEVHTLEAKLLQKDTECAGTKDSMKQHLGEQEDQLHDERKERKVEKEESTEVSSWVLFLMFLATSFGRNAHTISILLVPFSEGDHVPTAFLGVGSCQGK
jgi:hypothetical protein